MTKKLGSDRQILRKLIFKISLFLLGGLCLGLGLPRDVMAAGVPITDVNPMRMPAVGDYGLRVLSPTLLELTLITTKPQGQTPVTQWNFVSNGSFNAPSTSEFAVTVGNQSVAVKQIGFKRRALFAPLTYYDLRIGNYLYLVLASPIADGQSVQVANPSGNLWGSDKKFAATSDPLRFNPAIHVNQEGYMPNFAKQAMVSYYLGNMGEMPVSATTFKIVDAATGASVYSGNLTSRKDVGYTISPTPYQQVLQADFSSFNTPGEYRLQVPGLGASYSFMIDPGVAALFTRTYALGLYHQRCGFGNDFPYTRFVKGACHSAPALVPDMSFAAVNQELANMTGDYAASQAPGTPRLQDVNSSLYPFVNKGPIDVKGGHHDAGDYSKYTINVAQLVHSLVFAADAFPGVGSLDNLGLPESGDGKSDMLQEAKWEADFLVKMQDADGGFYFLVYPRNREYEDDLSLVAPELGDQQVVFPKTTAVTAAAVGALAEAGSSPLMKQQFPNEAATYLATAKKGWAFLQNAIAKYGRDGSYQKITHYGNQFGHNDELAWAAAALYAATGDKSYQSDLMAHFDPSDSNTLEWSWWRLFEGYGCAIRTYAFAARTGRLQQSQLDPTFLAKCEQQIVLAGDDAVNWANHNAFGNSFPDENKPPRTAGWFFSVNQAFDLATAYQITNKQAYIDTIIGNMNYEAGCNPVNMGFVTGVGWKRQRETVNQYAENDRRVLPPSGIPLGSVQTGFTWLYNYGSEPAGLSFPGDYDSVPYAPYDKWADTFNTTTEFVNPQQGHSLAAVAFVMARTSLKTQAWKPVLGKISGLPANVPAAQTITATVTASGIDLGKASCVWEARDQDPTPASEFKFSAVNVGPQWVEVEACLPDGRRIFATTNFNATTATNTPPNTARSAALTPSSDMDALYHLDSNLNDAAGHANPLTLSGSAALDPSNTGWMSSRSGASLRVTDLGDQAVVTIPNSSLVGSDLQSVSVEAMVYINAFKAYNRGNAKLISLNQNWNASLELNENMYLGPRFQCGTQVDAGGTTVTDPLTKNVWHLLQMSIDKTGYTIKVDGKSVVSQPATELANWNNNGGVTTLTLGNFDGWIDEVVVRSVRTSTGSTGGNTGGSTGGSTGGTSNKTPIVSLTAPSAAATYSVGSSIALTATAADTDGSIAKVEFFQGSTKIGEATSAPYTFVWNNALPGTYNVTAKATDNSGATKTSSAVSITVKAAPGKVAKPVIAPAGGTFTNSTMVTITCATPGARIYYTTDGSTPTGNSRRYTNSFKITKTMKVATKAAVTGMTSSPIAVATITIKAGSTQTNSGSTALTAPWKNADVGSVASAGSATCSSGTFTVQGAGPDIWGSADAFQFVYQPWKGNGEIVANITAIQAADPWAKAGVMFRESLDAGSPYAMALLTPANGVVSQSRATAGNSSDYALGEMVTAPHWVKLVRSGNTLTSYSSNDGTNWTQVSSTSVTMATNIMVGLAVTPHATSGTIQASFANVAVRTNSIAAGSGTNTTSGTWTNRDIGSVGLAGKMTVSSGTFSVSGSGADIWGTADAFQFAYQTMKGDGDIVAKVTSVQNTAAWAKAGVMLRETLDPSSANIAAVISPSGSALQWRASAGGSSDYAAGSQSVAPYWVKLNRSGNVFTGYISADGATWTTIGSQTIPMASSIYVGMISCSQNNSALSTDTFSNVRVSGSTSSTTGGTTTSGGGQTTGGTSSSTAWTSSDIGAVSDAGSFSATSNGGTLTTSGYDMWSTADAFTFAQQKWTGNGSIVARITDLQNSDAWAKAGVMFRETLDAGSVNATMLVSPSSGTAFQARPTINSYTVYNLGGNLQPPCWVKLTRNGDVFTGYTSTDGTTWSAVGSQTIPMASSIYVGMAVASHSQGADCAATFSDVKAGTNL